MTGGRGAGLFPLPGVGPPPPPGGEGVGSMSRSPRCVARRHRRDRINAVATQCTSALNDLAYSFVDKSRRPPCARVSSAAQQRLVARVRACASRFVSRRASGLSVDEIFSSGWKENLALQQQLPAASYGDRQSAVPLVADRVALPEVAGAVDLLSHLPPDAANFYSNPSRCIRQEAIGAGTVSMPNARVFASHAEYVRLLYRMKLLA